MFWQRRKRLDEELEHHLAAEEADNVARGMDPATAREAAWKTVGNLTIAKEHARELDPLYWLDTLWQDTRFAFRLIGRSRWMSATIVLTLTVGIGLNVSVFSVLNGMLLKSWVRHHPETFIALSPRYTGEYQLRFSDGGGMSQPDYLRYREQAKTLESLAAHRFEATTLGGTESGMAPTGLISCNFFDVVRPGAPLMGRYLLPHDCAKTGEGAVTVLTESAWRMRFHADPQIVGKTIYLNRVPITVVGVAPAFGSYYKLVTEGEVWVPYTMMATLRPDDDYFADRRAHWLNVAGRRKAEYSIEQVQQEINVLSTHADREVPGRVSAVLVSDGSLIQDPDFRKLAPLLIGLTLGTTSLLLLLACVNVTTLLLSRAAARQREIAVRLSLGAGRFRLLRQLLTEGLLLSSIAGGLSILVAYRAPAALWYSLMPMAPPFDLAPDWRVFVYCLGVAIGTGVIASLSPASESLRPEVAESLKSSGAAVTPGKRKFRLRAVLVGLQVTVSLVLLVVASLFARAQRKFVAYDPGFETKQVLSLSLGSVGAGYRPPPAFYQELEARVRALPGFVSMSYASLAPWGGRNSTAITELDSQPLRPTRDFEPDPARRAVSPEFFAVLDLPLLRGQVFKRHAELVPAVVSESMARRYWPGKDALGHRFRAGALHEVVGIVRDVHSVSFAREDGPLYYSPLPPDAHPPCLLIRVSGDANATAVVLREAVRRIDPQMAANVTPLATIVEEQAKRLLPLMWHGVLAGSLALVLALTGVYGVVAFSVSQRVREIGIRLALGAQRGDVMWLVLLSGAKPVLGGLLAGIALSFGTLRAIEVLLFGVSPRGAISLIAVPLLLLAAALGAIAIPARRAARLDPVTSLRAD